MDIADTWESDVGVCRRCTREGWSRDGICPSCHHPLVCVPDGQGTPEDGHADGPTFRSLDGLTVVLRDSLPPDARDELDGGRESVRETRRHDARWVRLKLDGIHVYLTGPLPPGVRQHVDKAGVPIPRAEVVGLLAKLCRRVRENEGSRSVGPVVDSTITTFCQRHGIDLATLVAT